VILDKLGTGINCANVFDAEITEDKKHVRLTEACDSYYMIDLTKSQMYELIEDLKRLADQIED